MLLESLMSEVISAHQCSSVLISAHQCSSVLINAHQRPSTLINANQPTCGIASPPTVTAASSAKAEVMRVSIIPGRGAPS